MKSTLLIILIFNSILMFPYDLGAQQNNGGPDGRITTTEPIHTHFILEDERALPITLNRQEINENTYNHTFKFLSSWQDKQVFIRFDEIDMPYFLKINGFNYGTGSGKKIPTEFNITPFLKQGINIIQLEFIHSAGSPEDHLTRPGILIIREPVHVRDILVTNYYQNDSNNSLVRINVYIQSFLTERNEGRILTMTISDPTGTILASKKKSIDFPLAFRQEVEFTFDQPIMDPLLWSPDHPALYSVQLFLVEKGQHQEELVSTTFGIRRATFEDSILVFNNDTIIPKVINFQLQQQHFRPSVEEVFIFLEEQGYNAVQTNKPIHARLMDLFDRQGIVVLKKEADRDPDLDRPDANRPSVVWIE